MIRIAILGDIGSGKSHIARLFGYPVFNADIEVAKLYKKNKKCYNKLKKVLPKHIISFPIKKNEILSAIIADQKNLKKIIKIIHPQIRSQLFNFIKKNKRNKIIVLDIPLLIENKINKKKEINNRLKKRFNVNFKIIKKFKKIQLPVEIKKKKSNFIIKNNFIHNSTKKNVKKILEKILLNERNSD